MLSVLLMHVCCSNSLVLFVALLLQDMLLNFKRIRPININLALCIVQNDFCRTTT